MKIGREPRGFGMTNLGAICHLLGWVLLWLRFRKKLVSKKNLICDCVFYRPEYWQTRFFCIPPGQCNTLWISSENQNHLLNKLAWNLAWIFLGNRSLDYVIVRAWKYQSFDRKNAPVSFLVYINKKAWFQ